MAVRRWATKGEETATYPCALAQTVKAKLVSDLGSVHRILE